MALQTVKDGRLDVDGGNLAVLTAARASAGPPLGAACALYAHLSHSVRTRHCVPPARHYAATVSFGQ